MVERDLAKKLIHNARQYPVVALLGPRQSGKTTLVKACFPDKAYVSLEDFDIRQFAEEDPRGFLTQFKRSVILDEIQRVPQLFSYIQTIVDANKEKGQYILTGSNQFLLMKNMSQSLAGRVSLLKLLPFSLNELTNSSFKTDDISQYLFKGCYPRLYDEILDSREWHQNYIEAYIEKDLKDFIQVSNLALFRKLLILLAASCGQLLNLSSLSNTIGVSHNTIKAWISALEMSYIVYLLQPYYKNYKKRIVKSPKIYFYDTGIAATLLKLKAQEDLDTHYLRGNLFENMIITEHLKESLNRGINPDYYFWRDHTGNEIDLIYEHHQIIQAVEIKSAQTIHSDFFSGFRKFIALSKEDAVHPCLIYGGASSYRRSGVQVISWRDLSSYFQKTIS